MDSLRAQSPSQLHRIRTDSNLSVYSNKSRIERRSSSTRARSVSTSQADRIHQLVLQADQKEPNSSLRPTAFGTHWLTPQHSPQPQYTSDTSVEPFPQWTVPTPPRSDSGLPTVSVDVNDQRATTGLSSTQDFDFDPPTASADMRYAD